MNPPDLIVPISNLKLRGPDPPPETFRTNQGIRTDDASKIGRGRIIHDAREKARQALKSEKDKLNRERDARVHRSRMREKEANKGRARMFFFGPQEQHRVSNTRGIGLRIRSTEGLALPVGTTRLPGSRRSPKKVEKMRDSKARRRRMGLPTKRSSSSLWAAAAAAARRSCRHEQHLPVKNGGDNDYGQHVDAEGQFDSLLSITRSA